MLIGHVKVVGDVVLDVLDPALNGLVDHFRLRPQHVLVGLALVEHVVVTLPKSNKNLVQNPVQNPVLNPVQNPIENPMISNQKLSPKI